MMKDTVAKVAEKETEEVDEVETEAKYIAVKSRAEAEAEVEDIAPRPDVFDEFLKGYARNYHEWDHDQRKYADEEESEWVDMSKPVDTYYNKTNCFGDITSKVLTDITPLLKDSNTSLKDSDSPSYSQDTESSNNDASSHMISPSEEEIYCGITLRQVRAVLANVERRCTEETWEDWEGNALTPETVNLYDIEKYIVKPFTKDKNCSFVSALPSTRGYRKSRIHISCPFSLTINKVLACLERFVLDFHINCSDEQDEKGGGMTEDTPVWLIGFATDQWKGDIYPEDPMESFMAKSAEAANYQVLSLTCKDGISFTRTWCVFEMSLGMDNGNCYIYTAQKMENRKYDVAGLVSGGATSDACPMETLKRENNFPHTLVEKGINFNVMDIEATKEADRERVIEWIESQRPTSPSSKPFEKCSFSDKFRSHFTTPGTLQARLSQGDTLWELMLTVMKRGEISKISFDFEEGRGWDKLTNVQAVNLIKALPYTIKSLDIRCAHFNDDFVNTLSNWIGSSRLTNLNVEDTFVNSRITEKSVRCLAKALKKNRTMKYIQIWRTRQGTNYRIYEEDLEILETLAMKGEATDAIFAPLETLYEDSHRNFAKITFLQALFVRINKSFPKLGIKTQEATIEWVQNMDDCGKRTLYHSQAASFVKTLLRRKFIEKKFLAVIMLDLYIQIALVVLLCFLNERESANGIIMPVLIACLVWIHFREYLQRMTTDTDKYLFEASNIFDTCQIILVFLTVVFYYNGEATQIQHAAASFYAMFVSWFVLIFKMSNIIFPIATLVIALIQIFKKLIPLLLMIFFMLLMFAHGFRAIYVNENCIANYNRFDDLNVEPSFEDGWKTCTVWDSYINSLQMFVTNANWSFLDKSGIVWTFFFAIIIGVIFMNIFIAVVSNEYTRVQEYAKIVFWEHRLSLIYEIENMWKCVNILFTCLDNKYLGKFPNLFFGEQNTRYSFGVGSKIVGDDDLNDDLKTYVKWLYSPLSESGGCPSTFFARLHMFYYNSIWKDIIFPGGVYTRVVLGIKRDENLMEVVKKNHLVCMHIILFQPVKWLLFVVHVLIMGFLFISGLPSLGLLWPAAMKDFIINVCQNDKEVDGSYFNDTSDISRKDFHKLKVELRDEMRESLKKREADTTDVLR